MDSREEEKGYTGSLFWRSEICDWVPVMTVLTSLMSAFSSARSFAAILSRSLLSLANVRISDMNLRISKAEIGSFSCLVPTTLGVILCS